MLYTNEHQCHYEDKDIPFFDDSVMVALLSTDDHGPVVDKFSAWCKHSL